MSIEAVRSLAVDHIVSGEEWLQISRIISRSSVLKHQSTWETFFSLVACRIHWHMFSARVPPFFGWCGGLNMIHIDQRPR